MKLSTELLWSAAVAALGGFLFGFDTAVISGATDALRLQFALDSGQLGFTVASALLGTIVGSVAAGAPAERYGRRPVLRALAVLYFLSAVGCGLAPTWVSLLIFRFIGGLAIGASSVVAPMYIAEISPAAVRGRLVALSQFNVVAGILAAYFSNYIIATILGGAADHGMAMDARHRGRARRAVLRVPAGASPRARAGWSSSIAATRRSTCSARWAPTTPRRWSSGRSPSRCTRRPCRRTNPSSSGSTASRSCWPSWSPRSTSSPASTRSSTTPPTSSRWPARSARARSLQSVVIGVTNLVFTMLAMTVIDRFGREAAAPHRRGRPRRLPGPHGVGVPSPALAARLVLAGLLGYIAFFAFSQGAVIWVYISEIFPNRVRARGQALGSFTHWVWAALVSWTFPVIAEASGASAFAFFAAMMLLQFVLVWMFLPETKGVSLERIQRTLGIE